MNEMANYSIVKMQVDLYYWQFKMKDTFPEVDI